MLTIHVILSICGVIILLIIALLVSFFVRLRRTGTAKIADYLDDGSFAREEPNNSSFKFKNEIETLEMKSEEKKYW